MANMASFSLIVPIVGDNASTSCVVGLGYTPAAATATAAYDATQNSVLANIATVVPGTMQVTINFVAPFSGTIQVVLALSTSTAAAAQQQPITGVITAVTAITNALPAGTNVIGHIISDSGSVVTATLNAETTKVIGVVRNADGVGNLFTSNSTTPAAHFAQDANITSILGTAPTTVGKLDVKGADGDIFVRQATAANLNATVVGTGTFAVQAAATLNAETTKVIGVVRNSDGAGNLWTSNSTTPAAHFAQDSNLTSILGTAPTTAGFIDIKGADGNVFVRNATAANFLCTASIAAAQTLATVTTVGTVTTVSAARIVGNTGATMDAAIGGAAPTNAQWHTNAPATASAAACTTGNAASLTVLNIKASAGNVYGVTVVNKTASVIYLQFYNTAGTPTLGTSVISWIPIAASATLVIPPGALALASYATGIGIGASTTPTSTGTPATAPDVTIWFK